ncbi:MAG TPA: N-acetylmuramoyl-L-alanine amidase [Actinophytocola sp.]|uniref:N-acetylmuramoyl-L-alanine amidase n=1 Tax=Actinophytocola sp. TaxID=1872138 RepID=UPI002DDD5A50|nr:N-acetylmuramoyl-L-alanine amidase [Actinophytocola sp.]HEV2781362.1 N-acetylmuramoyl-L-alanine amidase [Actinophytocola sp.]
MPTLVVQMGHCFRRTGATGTRGEQAFATAAADSCVNFLNGRGGWSVRKILADDPRILYRGDAFVAVHCDGSTNPSARGASVGYRTSEGREFGQAWKRAYAARGWPGFRPDNYTAALSGYYGTGTAVAQGNRRAVIVECGFLTNPEDRLLLSGPDGPARVALAIGDALGISTGIDQKDEDEMALSTEQWEPGTDKWGVIAVPPVGGSLSVPPDGQAWLHLRVPHQTVEVHGLWSVDLNGAGALLLENHTLAPDVYHRWRLPTNCMQVSCLYTAEVPIAATLETKA